MIARREEPVTGGLDSELQARKAPVLLTPVDDLQSFGEIDYIGTSFGLTLELFKFWCDKAGFMCVYLRQTTNDVTGECSAILLRPTDTTDTSWLTGLTEDFRARFLRLLLGPFQGYPIRLALSVVGVPAATDSALGLPHVEASNLLHFVTRHDLHRLELYANNMADYHLVTDLVPALAELYFARRLRGLHLSYTQAAVLLAVGRQNRTVEDVAEDLGTPLNQVLALFGKTIAKLSQHLRKLLDQTVPDDAPSRLDAGVALRKGLEEEQTEEGKAVEKSLHANKRALQKSLKSGEFAMPSADDDASILPPGKKRR